MPWSAALATFCGWVTGAITAIWSAVISPAANPAATAGRCSRVRPARTVAKLVLADSRQCPRSQEAIDFSPSCSGA